MIVAPTVSQPARPRTRRRRGLVAVALVACVALPACGKDEETESAAPAPAAVTDVAGSEVKLVTLTARAHDRLGIETVPAAQGRKQAVEVPFSAVIYDNAGATWVYAPRDGKPLSFMRQRVKIDDVRNDRARLLRGVVEPGMQVVSTGAAMLWGTELGVGAE